MIARFESNPGQQYLGRIGPQTAEERSIKRSTDLRISGRPDWRDIDEILLRSLSEALRQIAAIHPFFAANAFRDMGYNMQRTCTGEFYHWHVDSGPGEFSQRQLVALWYLNDVAGPGGETEFFFQQMKVKAEEGKLILFPPFWTHAHRGVTVQRGRKYIATTWVCFAPDTSARSDKADPPEVERSGQSASDPET
jgi:predicted 2-oxoglutarate/Fe(II)-dependent dioxygenase YbiX